MAVEYVIYTLAVILLIVFIVIWSLHFIALSYGKFKFHKKSNHPIERDKLPGISIIKPLMGVDDNLRTNLETFFNMDYPKYELLFCVQDNTDPVINLIKDLIDLNPNVDAKLYSGGKQVGINPKINNMMQGYAAMKYDFFLISDAGLRMNKDTLFDMMCLMKENVGLVHQMPFVCDRPGFAGVLEKVYFGTCHSRMYLFINLIGINCVTGMSCLMRKEVIEKVGGLQKFGNYIAEDYFLAQSFLDNNWKIQVSHQPAMQNSANYSIPSWQKRMIRWCKLRLKLSVMSWLEPMQECFMLGVCTSWTVNYLFGWNSLVFFLTHVLMWFLFDYMLLKTVQNGKLPFSKFEYIIAWLYRELICFYLFLKAASNPTVKWRDGVYRLKWGGLAEEIKPTLTTKSKLSVKDSSLKNGNNNSSTNKLLNSNGTSNNLDEDDDDDEETMKTTTGSNNPSSSVVLNMNQLGSNGTSMNSLNSTSNSTTTIINLNGNSTNMINGNASNQLAPSKIAKAPLLNHKRTSSFTAMINNGNNNANNSHYQQQQQQQQQQFNSNYSNAGDGNSSNGSNNLPPYSFDSNANNNFKSSSNHLKTPNSNLLNSSRSHHQYHHSISNPLQPQHQQPHYLSSNANQITSDSKLK